jgi:hypothetical protein
VLFAREDAGLEVTSVVTNCLFASSEQHAGTGGDVVSGNFRLGHVHIFEAAADTDRSKLLKKEINSR